jgi:helicase
MRIVKVLRSSRFEEDAGWVDCFHDGKVERDRLVCACELDIPLPFKFLNPLQSAFYRHYKGGSAVVSSSTGSGKTLIALLFQRLNKGGRFIYTAPTRSLIMEKFKEFRAYFPSVGIRTGDFIEELREITQPAVVCTYESLLAAMRNRTGWFEEAGALVVDEVHILKEPIRGGVVEEIICYCLKEGIPVLGLSATIPGAAELAEWLSAQLFVESEWRPVPLERKVYSMSSLLKKMRAPSLSPEEKVSAVVEAISPPGKTLVFLPRKDLGWRVLRVENMLYRKEVLNETLPFNPEAGRKGPVAFHNADIPQEERETIEREFKEGSLNRLYATHTLAYGVNLPADSVVIFVRGRFDRFTRSYSFFPDPLTLLQMEGRAGRFGFSSKGYSFLVVSGASDTALERALENELSKPFSTALSTGVEGRSGSACPNRRKSFLSLMVLGPMLRQGAGWKETVMFMYSVKRNPALLYEMESIVEELEDLGFVENGRLTPVTKLLVASFVSPFCFMDFVERFKKGREAIEDKTLLFSFSVRPLLRREFNPSASQLFAGAGFRTKAVEIAQTLEAVLEKPLTDNTEVFAFYTCGGFFPFKNVARPPGDFSTLPAESSLLAQLLCRLDVFDFDTVHRVAMMVRSGIPYEFSLLGSIEGLGYMRGNALAIAGRLTQTSGEVALVNAIKDGNTEVLSALETALAHRYSAQPDTLRREFNSIVKIVEKVKFPLGNLKFLRFLASLFTGRAKAVKLSKEDALEVLFENVKGRKKIEGQDRR